MGTRKQREEKNSMKTSFIEQNGEEQDLNEASLSIQTPVPPL